MAEGVIPFVFCLFFSFRSPEFDRVSAQGRRNTLEYFPPARTPARRSNRKTKLHLG